jgi:hypothetical protein
MGKSYVNIFDNLKALFSLSYYTAQKNKPFSNFSGLLDLTIKLGLNCEGNKIMKKDVKRISQITKTIRIGLICEPKNAQFVSLMLDARTNNVFKR